MLNLIKNWLSLLGSFFTAKILPAVIIAAIGILAIRLVLNITTKALERSALEKAAHSLILSAIRVVLYILLGLMLASKLGIDVTGIIALASVLTLAVSLAIQNALANVIGGFTLLYTHPFKSGDYVDIADQSGTVREIGLAYTQLTTADNKLVSIPNSAVVAAEIVNYTAMGSRRMEIEVSASYDSPVDTVLDALLEAANIHTVLPDPAPFAAVKAYGDSAVEYILRAWAATEDYWTAVYAINRRLKTVFDEKGIEMTYPHLNVHLDK